MEIVEQLDKLIKEGKKYKVIYSDCPWSFVPFSKDNKGMKKSPDRHYKTMNIEDIKALPVKDILDKDAVCFFWVYNPMIPEALDVLNAWGLKFKTLGIVWRKTTKTGKDHFGLGYYTRQNVELCFIATKGKPGGPKSKSVRQILHSQVREHSRKPDEMYDIIESLYDGPYLELFARNTYRKDWTKVGNEVGKLV